MSIFASLYTDEDISALGKTDIEQLKFAACLSRCIVTHNRVDFERLHLKFMEEGREHCGIIVVPQKSAYEVAQRVGILVSTLKVNSINSQLLYA